MILLASALISLLIFDEIMKSFSLYLLTLLLLELLVVVILVVVVLILLLLGFRLGLENNDVLTNDDFNDEDDDNSDCSDLETFGVWSNDDDNDNDDDENWLSSLVLLLLLLSLLSLLLYWECNANILLLIISSLITYKLALVLLSIIYLVNKFYLSLWW